MEAQPQTISRRAPVLAISAFLLALSLHLRDGLYSPVAVLMMAAAMGLCAIAAVAPLGRTAKITTVVKLLAGLVLLQLILMPLKPGGGSGETVPITSQHFYYVGLAIAAIATFVVALGSRPISASGFAVILIAFACLGIWKIRTAPNPKIDVFHFHVESARALRRGENPYSITFPDVYGSSGAYTYGPGIAYDGRLHFGYPYPPLILLTTAAGEIFLGDPRYAQLIAMIISAVLIVAIAPGRVGMLLAAMLLFTPRSFYVLEMSWTEPISLMLLVATVFFAMRVPVVAPIALGLLIASKQYLPAALFLLPLMSGARHESRRAKWGFVAVAVGVATAVTLPLAVWDFRAFWQSVVALQFKQPYRPDALSFLAWWGSSNPGWQGPFWACFVALGIGIGLSLWRARSFALGFALSFLAFFAFNKQAFANYYYLVLGALFCAIACENCISRESPADKQIIGPCADSSPLSSPP